MIELLNMLNFEVKNDNNKIVKFNIINKNKKLVKKLKNCLSYKNY